MQFAIKEQRERSGMTLDQLAEKSGISKALILIGLILGD